MSVYHREPGVNSAVLHESLATPERRMEAVNIILLFGCTGTGKTSFANIASGSSMEVGRGLRSSTKDLEASEVFQVDGQSVMVVDCPGFNDTYLTETEILRRLAEYLIESYHKNYKIVGLLYFHKISDTRVGGTSFRHMKMFKALCGSHALKHAIYVTNMWSEPPMEDEMLREEELQSTEEFFGAPLANGARMTRHYNTQESAHRIIRELLGKNRVLTELQRQLVQEKRPLEETDVGLIIGQDLEDDLVKQQKEMSELIAEKEKALKANDQNWLRQLEAQEERTKIKERQLVSQLQSLKTIKPKQLLPISRQTHSTQTESTNPELSALLARLEAKTKEPTRDEELQVSGLNAHTPSQQEWNKQMNDQHAKNLARIQAMRARPRRLMPECRAFGELLGRGAAFLLNNLTFGGPLPPNGDTPHQGEVERTGSRRNVLAAGSGGEPQRRAPDDEHEYRHPTACDGFHERTVPIEHVGDRFGPLLPPQVTGFTDIRSQQEQPRSGSRPHSLDGNRDMNGGGQEVRPAPPRELIQTNQSWRAPYQPYS